MRNLTLWESICTRAGKDGMNEILIEDAVAGSAVTQGIADVEIRQMLEQALVEKVDDQRIRLTESGRTSCMQVHRSPASITNPSAELGGPEAPQR